MSYNDKNLNIMNMRKKSNLFFNELIFISDSNIVKGNYSLCKVKLHAFRDLAETQKF